MRSFKIFSIFSAIVFIVITVCILFEKEMYTSFAAPLLWPRNFSCYFLRSRGIPELGTGEWDEAMLIPDRCIFFLETSCFGAWGVDEAILDHRRACAVESAARTNPMMNIFLLYLTPRRFSKDSAVLVQKLESYNNVYVRRISLGSYFEKTPLQRWFKTNIRSIVEQEDPQEIIYELVRLATLWKYGGIFADLQLILETPMETFTNFAAKSKTQNNSTVLLSFGVSTDLGQHLADFSLEEIVNSFDKKISAERIIENFCSNKNDNQRNGCKQFSIYPTPDKFSPNINSTKNCPKVGVE